MARNTVKFQPRVLTKSSRSSRTIGEGTHETGSIGVLLNNQSIGSLTRVLTIAGQTVRNKPLELRFKGELTLPSGLKVTIDEVGRLSHIRDKIKAQIVSALPAPAPKPVKAPRRKADVVDGTAVLEPVADPVEPVAV